MEECVTGAGINDPKDLPGQATQAGNATQGAGAGHVFDPDHPWLTLFCGHCGHQLKVELSCGSRVCPKCRRKWYGYHYKSLVNLVRTWPKGSRRSMTLTLKNIPDIEFSRYSVKDIRAFFSKLRSKFKKEILGGFYVVQATNSGNGWHLHLHVLYDGSYIRQRVLAGVWKEITGSYVVHIQRTRTVERAVSYLLADFSGKPRIRPEDAATYDAVFKGSRLVQPFGVYRHYKFKVPFKCPECGCTYWALLEDLIGQPRRFHRDCGGP